ncbi:vascular endothelial growth factor receptor kdr-like isoform X2 [Chrysoperla carnea]|uniref:vascular endothelial growth factor receptor kdr-like isoform X2 n=1 Tax=Chrysoperla carnea TaxID=189513 RepID=UPI001D0697AF|nr:vascular endothelial growth factor receptor kdr-like isoform X2 [Chrysoperla carnea]
MSCFISVCHQNLLTILTCYCVVIFIQITPGLLQDINVSRPIQPPEILNLTADETIISTGENLTLICHGIANITWSYNEVIDSSDEEKRSQTYKLYRFDPDISRHEATLIITNATYLHTGNYVCEYQSPQVLESNSIYVYVEDENNLFLPYHDTIIIGHQYQNVTVPCRPTSPRVQVELRRGGQPVTNEINYDPKVGITLYLNGTAAGGRYTCIGSNNFKTEELIIPMTYKRLPASKYAPTPKITDESEAHYVGLQLQLKCEVQYNPQSMVRLAWHLPSTIQNKESRLEIRNDTIPSDSKTSSIHTIILSNLMVEDSGVYICSVIDHSKNEKSKNITINVKDSPYIHLTSKSSLKPIKQSVGKDVKFIVNVDAYPRVKYEWFFNNNEITPNLHYNVTSTPKQTKLIISKVSIHDDGLYMLRATNHEGFQSINMTLEVPDRPCVSLSGPSYILVNNKKQFNCTAVGNPIPKISWSFKECLRNDECPQEPIPNNSSEVGDLLKVTSLLTLNKNVSGTLICEASNTEGSDLNLKEVIITDVPDGDDGFNAWQENEIVSVGDSIVLHCGASKHNYSGSLEWYLNYNDNPLTSNEAYEIDTSSTPYSYRKSIKIPNVTKDYSGNYRCDDGSRSSSLALNVLDPELPAIIDSNLKGNNIKIHEGRSFEYMCSVSGIPRPTITWKKNDKVWVPDPKRIRIKKDFGNLEVKEVVIFKYTIKEDEGKYSCEATNRLGQKVNSSLLMIDGGKIVIDKKISPWIIIVPIFCIIILIIAVSFLFIKLRNEKRRIAEFENAGLDHFDEGDVECINPDLAIDDQADLLPYYNEWEFPREKLKLGKVLGAGAFGIVMKAEAQGILTEEENTTVAVKMVKRNADITYVKALASELKIMVHLGRHVNVANLLGACTKNLASKRELCVIVEYCRYGNLLNYIQRHRRDFVNQIDPSTGDINTAIGQDILARSGSTSAYRNSNASGTSKHARSGGADYRAQSEISNSRNSNENTCNTEVTTLPMSTDEDDVTILSNNSTQQPEWRSNYQGDYRGNVAPMSSQDLLCWAFQIARGMDYLVSRNVLHGDLAARNVLLADNNIVKICDFGLAKSMYKDANYVKKKNSPLPIKWMALESIRDRIFSVRSDVWSYGIVLWELFSLGQTPYPGMKVDETFYHKLEDGYRLSKPEFSTKELYQVMLQCWEARPKNRPTFDKLANDIGMMLENAVREHYINLNSPYLIMNDMKSKEHSDYLAMMSTPDFDRFESSNYYINELPTSSKLPQSDKEIVTGSNTGYLCMRPTSALINFDNPKKTDKSSKDVTSPEMLPMLSLNNSNSTKSDIESDSELTTPDFKNKNQNSRSFFNPTYQTPTGSASASPTSFESKTNDIVTTKENYVNMPEQKSVINDKSKPKPVTIDIDKNLDDQRIYVNDNVTDHWIR